MAVLLVPDELWAAIAPHLPPEPPRPKGGRPRVSDRRALTGIVFVLVSGIAWERLPRELGCGSGMTCWRRLRDWQRAGAWETIRRGLLDRLGGASAIDWGRCSLDCAVAVPAKRGAGRSLPARPTAAGQARTVASRSAPAASASPPA